MKPYISFILFFLTFFLFNTAGAEGVDSVGNGSVSVSLSPEFPGPSEKVTAEIVSGLINLNISPITWILDGKVKLQGVGEKSFIFKTGEVGSSSSLRFEIRTDEYGIISKDIEIQPSDMDIIWEADTYTPPFYKGKALPASRSYLKVLSIPNIVTKAGKTDPRKLVYQWKKTYEPNPNDSGLGKNIFLYRGSYTYNEALIETTVSTADETISVSKKTKIPVYEPKIIFYEIKPLEGTQYQNSLGENFTLKEKEETIRAEPYFFSFKNANINDTNFTWTLDGKELEINLDRKSEFILRKPEKGSGNANITLSVDNEDNYDLQSASKSATLSYTN